MGGDSLELRISSSKTVRQSRHAVRRLTNENGAFDIVPMDKPDITFGFEKDFGTKEYFTVQSRKLCNLRLRNGSAIMIVRRAPTFDVEVAQMVADAQMAADMHVFVELELAADQAFREQCSGRVARRRVRHWQVSTDSPTTFLRGQ